VQFSQVRKLRDLGLDLRSGRGHTGVHMWSRSTHTSNYMEIGKTLWTYGRIANSVNFSYLNLYKLSDMSKNLLILEFSPGTHIMYTTLKKLLWQPW